MSMKFLVRNMQKRERLQNRIKQQCGVSQTRTMTVTQKIEYRECTQHSLHYDNKCRKVSMQNCMQSKKYCATQQKTEPRNATNTKHAPLGNTTFIFQNNKNLMMLCTFTTLTFIKWNY